MTTRTLQIPPIPADLLQARIRVDARFFGTGNWRSVPVGHAGSIDETPHAKGGCEGWVAVSTDACLEFRVTLPDPVSNAILRPSLQDPVDGDIEGRTIRFRVESPRYLVLEINQPSLDDRWSGSYTLYLLIDEIDATAPEPAARGVKALSPGHHLASAFDPGDAHTLLLLPGVHTVEGQMIDLYSDKTLYLAGGAHLRSYIRGEGVNQAAICGRGVIDGTGVDRKSSEWRDDGDAGFVFFRRGEGNLIDGPMIFDSPFWNIVTFGTRNTVIRNHKCITWKVNNDGIQPRSCNDLLVEHCFLKCADDCIAVKTRRTAGMQSGRLVFRNLTLWNDTDGNPMEIGHTSQADVLENVLFQDIAVVHAAAKGHTISVCIIDHCEVRNVRYENIRVEGCKVKDVGLRITTSRYTTDAERGRIDGVTIRSYTSDDIPQGGEISGFDESHMIKNVIVKDFAVHAADPKQSRIVEKIEEIGLSLSHCANLRLQNSC